MKYKGINRKGKEYIISLNEREYPYKCIVKFPEEELPIRVDFIAKSSSSNGGTIAQFMIPAEMHESWDKGWQLFYQGDKMLITKGTEMAFLEQTEGYEDIDTNFKNFPTDIYDYVEFVEFDDFYMVRYSKKYCITREDHAEILDVWNKYTREIKHTKIINADIYRDGGTFIADYELEGKNYHLYIPTPLKKGELPMLNEVLKGKTINHYDEGYWQLWKCFRKDSGLKLYYVNDRDFDLNPNLKDLSPVLSSPSDENK